MVHKMYHDIDWLFNDYVAFRHRKKVDKSKIKREYLICTAISDYRIDLNLTI